MFSKYVKKPVVIDALKFTKENKDQVFNLITCHRMPGWDQNGDPMIIIKTLEGDMNLKIGEWLIKGVNGEFYPCKDDIFQKTYESAE